MYFVKQVFNFYINSSIHVALAVYALSWITLLELGVPYDENLLYFIFYASITGYNFVKYFGIAKFHHRQLADYLKLIQVFSFACFILMCYYGFRLELKTLILSFGLGILTFLYAIPLFPNRKHTLRNIEGLKVFVIALTWAGVTVLIPVTDGDYAITDVVLITLQRFIFVLVLMIPFEIRDIKYDSEHLSTIPQKLGLKGTKILGIVLLSVFFFLEFFKDEISSISILILLIISLFTALFVVFSKVEQGKYYSSFWVEGLPILWLILVLVLS